MFKSEFVDDDRGDALSALVAFAAVAAIGGAVTVGMIANHEKARDRQDQAVGALLASPTAIEELHLCAGELRKQANIYRDAGELPETRAALEDAAAIAEQNKVKCLSPADTRVGVVSVASKKITITAADILPRYYKAPVQITLKDKQ